MTRILAAAAFAALLLATPASAQMGQGGGQPLVGWKELDSYHMLMMATWHPVKQQGELAPLRELAPKMVAAAEAIVGSTAPATCDTPELKQAGQTLVTETKKVATMVEQKANDALLALAMVKLHDQFEVLQKGCRHGK